MASPRPVAVSLLLVAPSSPSTAGPRDPFQPSFLLCSSRKLRPDGSRKWVFPKGGIEHGESPREAAERESWEEAGLRLRSAIHLTHLLTTHDPAPHILSPSTDPGSPSFVPACRYEFELFLVPALPEALVVEHFTEPPPPSSPSRLSVASSASSLSTVDDDRPSSLAFTSTPTASSERSPTTTTTTNSDSDDDAAGPVAMQWPESHERTRLITNGWDETERRVCWGRREGVMRLALDEAKEWVRENWTDSLAHEAAAAAAPGRIPHDGRLGDDES
ncbi:hypothetical protein JCM10212_001784 [Sporobolomyces blumeae]